jgi:predicted component of type VI protein secretion system
MNKAHLKQLIREELSKILNEEILTYDELLAKYNPEDGPAYLQGLINEPGFMALSPEKQKQLFSWIRYQEEMDR